MRKICIFIIIILSVISCSGKQGESPSQSTNSSDSVYFDLLQRATGYLQSGKFDNAEQTLSQAENIEPKLPMAYYMHGILYYNQRNIEKSSSYFIKALQRCNDEEKPKLISDIATLTSLPDSEEEDKLIKQAQKAESGKQRSLLEKALNMNRFNSTTYFLLAENYKKTGNFNKALNLYNEAIILHPAHEGALRGLTGIYKDSDRKEYEKVLKERMEYFGVEPDIRHQLASFYNEENLLDNAVILLERNTKEYPAFFPSYYLLGKIYVKQEKKDLARQKLVVFSDEKEQEYFSEELNEERYKEYKSKASLIISEIQ